MTSAAYSSLYSLSPRICGAEKSADNLFLERGDKKKTFHYRLFAVTGILYMKYNTCKMSNVMNEVLTTKVSINQGRKV